MLRHEWFLNVFGAARLGPMSSEYLLPNRYFKRDIC